MRSQKKIWKFFQLIKKLFRILWVVIFIHWIFWATTYARAPHYKRAIEDEKITQHTHKTQRYKDNVEGWMGKIFENKPAEFTLGEVEKDVLSQIETQTGKKNLAREWDQQLPVLEKLTQEIKTLEGKGNLSSEEQKKLDQKKTTYQENLSQAKEKIKANIQKQLNDNKLNVTELNDRRGLGGQLFIDPLKFFLVNPLNQTCKALQIFARSETSFFLAEIIFKIAVVKLFCLWIGYPESINTQMQEGYQKIQNPHLSLEEREQSQQEVAALFKYQLFNITLFYLPFFVVLHPAHFDKTSSIFLQKVPFAYLLIPLLIIPFLLSALSTESIRLGRIIQAPEIKTYLIKSWFFLILIFPFMAAMAYQSQGNYWWILFSLGIDFLFNSIRIGLLRTKTKPPTDTFKVTRVKGNPDKLKKAD